MTRNDTTMQGASYESYVSYRYMFIDIIVDKTILNVIQYDMVKIYYEIGFIQNQLWSKAERFFGSNYLLGQLKKQAIEETIKYLKEAGICNNIENEIKNILLINNSTGGSYASLAKQLASNLAQAEIKIENLQTYSEETRTK